MRRAVTPASNVRVHGVALQDFKRLVHRKLGVDLPLNATSMLWARKLPEMKMLSALLFNELLTPRHRYWGYFDLDLVWGNVSRFAHWFQGDFLAVKTQYWAHGPAHFLANDERMIRLYFNEQYVNTSLFLSLLTNVTNFNLDEVGMYTPDRTNHKLAIHWVLKRFLRDHDMEWNGHDEGWTWPLGPKCPRGFVFLDEEMVLRKECSLGPALWMRGSLRLVEPTEHHPAGREIMFFHRPRRFLFSKRPSAELKSSIVADMLKYGFLLPTWSPLVTHNDSEYKGIRPRDYNLRRLLKDKVCNRTVPTTGDRDLYAASETWKGTVCFENPRKRKHYKRSH